jgi:hypothetical protein
MLPSYWLEELPGKTNKHPNSHLELTHTEPVLIEKKIFLRIEKMMFVIYIEITTEYRHIQMHRVQTYTDALFSYSVLIRAVC